MNTHEFKRRMQARQWVAPCLAGAIALTLFTPSASPKVRPFHSIAGIVPPPGAGNGAGPRPNIARHLSYYGGHVISNIRVVQVIYGSGTFLGNVTGTTSPTTAQYYAQLVNSPYMDWLREYDTDINDVNGHAGTNQNIGRGSFYGRAQITPAAANNGATITDAQIQAELSAQIDAGHLPAPSANTYYATYFPSGKVITGPGTSCTNFYAYHGSYYHNSQIVYYGVMPDLNSSGCHPATGLTQFQTQTEVDSHELTETVTDGGVGVYNSGLGAELAWYDFPNGGEIGDLCAYVSATLAGSDGNSYTVQTEWSNANNTCIAFPNANYYVDGVNGNDANFGTPTHPYKTIRAAHNANPTTGKANIYVRPTNYPEPPLPLNLNKVEQILNWNGNGAVHVGSP